MFDAPADAAYLVLGVAAASAAVFGVAVHLPTSPPPDAARAADAVDSVTGCPYDSTAEVPLSVTEIRIEPHGLDLRDDGGTAHATFAFGPVTPAETDDRLDRVLRGTPPESAFESPADFRAAIDRAHGTRARWRSADDRLLARCVSWEGVDATLVAG
jgi:hypothetical protein